MTDKWKVKDVQQSGSDVWIKIGTEPIGGTSDRGFEYLLSMIVLSFSFMHIFGVTGFAWWVFWAVISLILTYFLLWPCFILSLIIAVCYFAF